MRRLTGLLAALLLGSAAGAVVVSAPASAAACTAGSGVTVVVGSNVSCDADGGGPASSNFRDAGHTLTPVDRQPGFVCQVDGAPSSARCVDTPPSNAYWGLFWSDGTSGTWTYASQGVGSLKVPAGGWVAFVFQDSGTRTPPSVRPIGASAAKPTSEPSVRTTKKPSPAPTRKPSSSPSATRPAPAAGSAAPAPTSAAPSPAVSPSATEEPTAAPSPSPSPTAPPATPSATLPTPDSTDETAPAAAKTDDGDGLGWVAGALIVALLAGTGAVAWRRRTAGGAS